MLLGRHHIYVERHTYGETPYLRRANVFALRRYDVSPQRIRLIETYYEGFLSKSFSESATSA